MPKPRPPALAVGLLAIGFADLLPPGKGFFAVSTVEEADEAIREIRRDYAAHPAARAPAQVYFDCTKIAGRVLAEAGIGPRDSASRG